MRDISSVKFENIVNFSRHDVGITKISSINFDNIDKKLGVIISDIGKNIDDTYYALKSLEKNVNDILLINKDISEVNQDIDINVNIFKDSINGIIGGIN